MTASFKYSDLFTPWRRNKLDLANRLAVAPMTRISASEEGIPSDRMLKYYVRFPRGGFALVITEGIYTDEACSQGYLFQPGLANAEQAKGWRRIVDAVHAAGGKIYAQLMHAGALVQGNRFTIERLAPSAIRPKGLQMSFYRGEGAYPMPRGMTDEDIAEVITGFADAAARAVDVAGFDGIEIHGANGYLLDQFLTDYTNQRNDFWGGPIGNRIRMSIAVAQAVRRSVGNVPVGIRISQSKVNDFTHKWADAEEGAAIVFRALAQAELDYIHITEHEAWRPAFGETGPSLVGLARKSAPGLTIIANGSLEDPRYALQALEQGANLVALGKGALANPDWPLMVAEGRETRGFDRALLTPLGDIKHSEIEN